jgi:hypothetical protein
MVSMMDILSGAARLLVDVRQPAPTPVVSTEPATLLQAMTQGQLSVTASLPSGSGTTSGTLLGPDYASSSDSGLPSSLKEALHCTTTAGAAIVASLSIKPSITLDAKWGFFRIDSASLIGKVTETASLTATAGAGATCTLDPTDVLPTPVSIPFTADIGIPVTGKVNVLLNVSGTASTAVTLTAGVSQTLTATAGIDDTNGTFSPVASLTNSFKYSPPTLTGTASIKVAVGPEMQVLLYDIAGPEVNVYPYLLLSANTSQSPWWKLYGGVEAGGGFVVPKLDINYSDPNIIHFQEVLLQAKTSPPPPPPLSISTSSLPSGKVGAAYSATLAASGGTTPYTWSVSSGQVPGGLKLASSGTISGIPTTAGTSSFTVKVTDGSGVSATKSLSIAIAPAASAPWISQSYPSGLPLAAGELEGVSCPTVSDCVTVGFGSAGGAAILATTDGGATWTAESYPSGYGLGSGGLYGVSCPTTSDCIAVGAGNGAVILATTDGGATWTAESYPSGYGLSSGYLQGISCSTDSDCVTTGGGNGTVLLATTNGGATWNAGSYPSGYGLSSGGLYAVSCPTTSDCIAAGEGNGAVILATTDGGATWTAESYPSGYGLSSGYLLGVSCPTRSDCLAVGQSAASTAVAIRTTDGGSTWSAETLPSGLGGADLFSVSCTSATSCVAVGPDNDITTADGNQTAVVVETSNGGSTWSLSSLPTGLGLHTNGELLGVSCVPGTVNSCWAVGQGGTAAVILTNTGTG